PEQHRQRKRIGFGDADLPEGQQEKAFAQPPSADRDRHGLHEVGNRNDHQAGREADAQSQSSSQHVHDHHERQLDDETAEIRPPQQPRREQNGLQVLGEPHQDIDAPITPQRRRQAAQQQENDESARDRRRKQRDAVDDGWIDLEQDKLGYG